MAPLVDYFVKAWQRSFDYTGRSTRPEYWWFYLANILVAVLLAVLSGFSDLISKFFTLYALASFLPGLSLTVRRLRGAGKHWAWMFIGLIPFIGGIWLIVLLCQPSISLPPL
jgi:uncharacterized membrane protein YhaH (DUF805 family)